SGASARCCGTSTRARSTRGPFHRSSRSSRRCGPGSPRCRRPAGSRSRCRSRCRFPRSTPRGRGRPSGEGTPPSLQRMRRGLGGELRAAPLRAPAAVRPPDRTWMIPMRTLPALALSLVLAAPLAAQDVPAPQAGAEVVDRVVAVVGDTVLLLSEVQTELQQLEATGRLPADPVQRDAMARSIVEARVNDLLLLEAAQEAGVEVSPEQVNETVEQSLAAVRRQFRSE